MVSIQRIFRNSVKLDILFLMLLLQKGTNSVPVGNGNDIGGNLNEMLGEFRREQIFMSNTMLNKSRALNLPEKLAEAEVEEAEQRREKAYRGKSEAKTPFIATNSRYSLGYIGRGYDLFFGNPLSDDGVVDQGFRLPVVDLPFSFRFTSDGEYRIPDNVDVISEPSAFFGSSFYQVKSESDYQRMLNADASVNAHASGFGLSGSFSASFAYQNSKRNIEKQDTTSINIIGRAVVYKARLSSTARMSKVSDYFESAVKALPTDRCEEDNMQRQYLQVIEDFGTHYTTQVVMGAKAVNEIRVRTSDLERLSTEGISAKVAAEILYNGVFVSAGGGISAGLKRDKSERNKVSNTAKGQTEYYIGGSPPSGNIGSGQGSTEVLREWAKSASENPVPIQYKLSSIETLLYPDNFRDLTYGFYERRKCLRKALLTYCMNIISPDACIEQPRRVGRRKRDTDSDVQPVIKYGDFITLKNKDRYLAISRQYGTSTGSAIKLLTSVQNSEDFNGLFQIIPLEGQENKMELEVHYGEPFLLKSIEDELMYMGKKFISNVEEPSEARLMDLFDETRSRVVANKSKSYVQDFAIFHQRNDLRVYVVSLEVNVHCSITSNTSSTYQVEIFGKGVSVKTFVTARCTCVSRTCKGNRWFHSFVVEKDIGTLESSQILTFDGTGDEIKDIQVKTIINGLKERYRPRNELRCKPYMCDVRFITPEKDSLKSEAYTIQFSFQNKQRQQNLPVRASSIGYIHIHSSFPKRKYWGHDVSHLLSMDSMDMVTIKEKGPEQNKIISTDCNSVIFPSLTHLTNHHFESSMIMISFDVIVKIEFVEVRSNNAPDLKMSYYDRKFERANEMKHDRFVNTSAVTSNTNSNTASFRLSPSYPVYTNAIKLSTNNNNMNLTSLKNVLTVVGCHKVLLDRDYGDNQGMEWQIHPSNKEIQNYPFLRLAPILDTPEDSDGVYGSTVTKSLSFRVPISGNKINCSYHTNFIQNFLTKTRETSKLKYEEISVNKPEEMAQDGHEKYVDVRLLVTGLSKEEFEDDVMYLNKTLKTAIDIFPCNDGNARKFSENSAVNQNDGYGTVAIAIAVTAASIVAVGIILTYTLHRRHSFKMKKLGDSISKESKKRSQDDERKHLSIIYQNKMADDTRMNFSEENLFHKSADTLFDQHHLYHNESIFASRSDLNAERVRADTLPDDSPLAYTNCMKQRCRDAPDKPLTN